MEEISTPDPQFTTALNLDGDLVVYMDQEQILVLYEELELANFPYDLQVIDTFLRS
jgi:hypothetical protein